MGLATWTVIGHSACLLPFSIPAQLSTHSQVAGTMGMEHLKSGLCCIPRSQMTCGFGLGVTARQFLDASKYTTDLIQITVACTLKHFCKIVNTMTLTSRHKVGSRLKCQLNCVFQKPVLASVLAVLACATTPMDHSCGTTPHHHHPQHAACNEYGKSCVQVSCCRTTANITTVKSKSEQFKSSTKQLLVVHALLVSYHELRRAL